MFASKVSKVKRGATLTNCKMLHLGTRGRLVVTLSSGSLLEILIKERCLLPISCVRVEKETTCKGVYAIGE